MKLFISILISLLILRFALFRFLGPHLATNKAISFTTTLLTDPQETSRYNRLTAYYKNFFGSEKIIITYKPELKLNYGDTIKISGHVQPYVPGFKSNLISSKNNQVLNSSTPSMYFPVIEPVKNTNTLPNNILALSYSIRQKIKDLYYSSLFKTDASLLLGIVLGVKGDFTKQINTDFQVTGVMHVIAASGMNVTMVAAFLIGILKNFLKRQQAIVITILGILFYMVLSGLGASIVRAGIMSILVFSSQITGRQYSGLYGLFLAVFGMLFFDPSLLFDVGFELSVLATLGIIVIKPILPFWSWFDDIGTTFSAQIITMPILIGTFNNYGLLSILVNFLVLWTVAPLMIIGGIAAIFSFLFFPLAKFILILAIPFLWFFEKIIIFFGEMKWQLSFSDVPIFIWIGYYLCLFSVIIAIRIKKNNSQSFQN